MTMIAFRHKGVPASPNNGPLPANATVNGPNDARGPRETPKRPPEVAVRLPDSVDADFCYDGEPGA